MGLFNDWSFKYCVNVNPGNFYHGAYQSGDKLLWKKEALYQYLKTKPEAFFQALSESIEFDRELRLEPGSVAEHMEGFLEAKSIRQRCEFVARMFKIKLWHFNFPKH